MEFNFEKEQIILQPHEADALGLPAEVTEYPYAAADELAELAMQRHAGIADYEPGVEEVYGPRVIRQRHWKVRTLGVLGSITKQFAEHVDTDKTIANIEAFLDEHIGE